MTTPEELLCSRKWRMVHGAWMLWGWFPFAWTAWVGYLIIGIKARNWKWIATSVTFFVFGLTSMIMIDVIQDNASSAAGHTLSKGETVPEPWAKYDTIVVLVLLAVWIINGAVVQRFVNRKWLVWRARNSGKVAKAWYVTATATPVSGVPAPSDGGSRYSSPVAAIDNALRVSHPEPTSAASNETGIGASSQEQQTRLATLSAANPSAGGVPYLQASVATQATVDLNNATRDQLAALPGVDLAMADHIIDTRRRIGAFSRPDNLVTMANVPPHVFVGIQGSLVVTPLSSASDASSQTGRRLEF